jgi:hypothetical protein
VVGKVALGEVSSPEYFGFRISVSLHQCSVLIQAFMQNGRYITLATDTVIKKHTKKKEPGTYRMHTYLLDRDTRNISTGAP